VEFFVTYAVTENLSSNPFKQDTRLKRSKYHFLIIYIVGITSVGTLAFPICDYHGSSAKGQCLWLFRFPNSNADLALQMIIGFSIL